MRRAVIAGLVVVAAMVVIWKLACNHGPDEPSSGSSSGSSAGSATTGPRVAKPPAAPASLSGRVTKAGGRDPIAGANVAIALTSVGPRMGPMNDTPSTIATTDATGAWSVPSIPPGTYVVTAAAAGFLPATTDKLAVAAGERKEHVDLALDAGGTQVSGTITDVGGGAIAGARVTMRRGGMLSRGQSDEVVALSRDDGTYKLTLPDGDWSATVTHEDYSRSFRWFRVASTPLVLDFVLVPGAVIRGQVVAKDGTPVPGATVTSRGERKRFESFGRATSDADGKFTLKGVGSGAIALSASARGYASKNPTTVTVGIGEQVDNVRIVVDHAFSISGTVVKAGTKQGLPGVRVNAFTMSTGNFGSADPTEADGAFEITGIGPASYLLFAMGEGVMPEMGKAVEVVDKDVTGIVVEMSAGATLSGKVDPPAATALHIEADMEKIGIGGAMNAAKAFSVGGDSDPTTGAFVLKNVPAGEFSLIATHTDGRTGKLAIVVAEIDQTSLVVTLEPRASIAGKVVDANGAAVSGVRVSASGKREPGGAIRFDRGVREGVVTGADGAFKIVGLDPGKLEVSVRDDQGKLAWARGDKPVEVELTKAQELTGLVLTVEARDGKITGKVTGSDGKPGADAWITATYQAGDSGFEGQMSRMMGGQLPVLTTPEGRFVLDHLRRGTYQIVVEGSKGMSRAEATAKVGDDVSITLAALGTMSGRVTANGAPVKMYDLACRQTNGGSMMPGMGDSVDEHVAADDGSYTADHVVPGGYECTITADTGTAKDTVAIPSGPFQHDFALVAFGSVTGIIVDAATGKPLPGVMVFSPQPGNAKAMTQMMSGQGPKTDASGKFVLDNQPVGSAHLMVMNNSKLLMPAGGTTTSYTLTAGQHLDLGTIKVEEMTSMPSMPRGSAGSNTR